jgi:Baculovirus FP protein
MNCVECETVIEEEEEYVSCNKCKLRVIHTVCIKRKPGRPPAKWLCDVCNKTKGKEDTQSEASEDDTEIKTPTTQKLLLDIIDRLERMEKNTKEIPEIQKALDFLDQKYEAQKIQLQEQDKSIKKLNEQVLVLNNSLKERDIEMRDMSARVHELEQAKLSLNVEVHNLEMLPNESTLNVVECISKKMGIQSEVKSFIEDAYRVPQSKKNSRKINLPPVLVVKFKVTDMRRVWLDRKKTADLTSGSINNNNNSNQIRVYEQLTPHYRSLLFKARTAAREMNYQYTWTKNGKIFMKRSDDSGTTRIASEHDVNRLLAVNRPSTQN